MNLRKQTKELLGFIYITWWCSKEEREKYKSLIQNGKVNQKEGIKSYDVNDIFKNKKENKEYYIQEENVEQTSIATCKKENVFKKVLNKILSFLNFKKGEKV